jgi:small-conductance mechanosensitive channel
MTACLAIIKKALSAGKRLARSGARRTSRPAKQDMERSGQSRTSLRRAIAVCVGCCLAVCAVVSFAAELPEKAGQASAPPRQGDEAISSLWAARTEDLTAIISNAELLMNKAEVLSKALNAQMQTSGLRFQRLSGLFQASASHPGEQLTLARQLAFLREELAQSISPLAEIHEEISQRLAYIAQMKTNLQDADAQSAAEYLRALTLSEQKLSAAFKRMNTLLNPGRTLLSRMDKSVSQTEKHLSTVWENYYVLPAKITPRTLGEVPFLLTFWKSSLNTRLSFAYPQSTEEWISSAVYFGAAILLAGLLGLLGLRLLSFLPRGLEDACGPIIRRSWPLCGFGLAALASSINPQGGTYTILGLAGALILIAGIASLSWKLRVALIPELANHPSPLNRLYPPAAIGVCALFADFPEPVLGLFWSCVSLAFSAIILVSTRSGRKDRREKPPALERFAATWGICYGIPAALAALAGYAHLAILVFMLCFALTNLFILGLASVGLLHILAARLLDPEKYPVRNAVGEALSIPAAWFFALFSSLPWFWVAPGADELLRLTLARNYTLGEADFNIYKILLIILLFFLCRSFISLGKTSLTHLSDKMPQFERGVIPPLRAMFSYLLWAGFLLVALSLLDVDLTSLAVVAGGLSVGIGFGLQTLFNNLISGLILIFGRSLLVGDYITVGDVSGTVQAIGIRATILQTFEKASVYLPNSAIISGNFTNWTRQGKTARRSLNIGVAYGTDTELVISLLKETALKQEHVLKNPPPVVYFSDFGASSLDFVLNVFIDNFDFSVSAMSELRLAVEKAFREKGIDIPFPQMTVHMAGASAEGG